MQGHGDFSYFIVAGSDFVDPHQTPSSVIIQPGQGYDGQFFYRYSLNPFNFLNPSYGIHVDLPPYRLQRITYPVLTWLMSLGGNPVMVPWMMVLLNVFAFIGIIFYTRKFIAVSGGLILHQYFPLLLCGLYMSLARDLSEILELFFFMGSIYYLFRYSYARFAIFATLTLLTRETSLIALFPLTVFAFLNCLKSRVKIKPLIFLFIPYLFLFVWKYLVMLQTGTSQFVSATHNMSLPLVGLIEGFRSNLDWSSTKNRLQLIFWLMYFLWQVAMTAIVLKSILHDSSVVSGRKRPFVITYIIWLLFASCFSAAIYSDDWSFVRLFSIFNMIGFVLLILQRYQIGTVFKVISLALVMLTIARLIIRV